MRNILKIVLFFAICGFANAQNIVVADTCPKLPCNKPTSCPNKKYPYYFGCQVVSGQNQLLGTMYCTDDPNNFATGLIPLKIRLPLCAEFDKDTLYNTNNPQEKMYDTFCLYPKHKKVVAVNDTAIVKDTVCIFDIKKIHCDLAEALHEWNCLCDKQNEPCECKLKIRFSNRPEDFDDAPMNEILGICSAAKSGVNTNDSCKRRCPTTTGIFINFGKGVTDRSDTVNIFYYNGESSDSAMQSNLQKLRNGVGGQTKGVSLRDLLLHELGHVVLPMVNAAGHYYGRDSLGRKINALCDTVDGIAQEIDGIMRGSGGGGNANREGLSQDDKCMFMKLYCQSGISDVEYFSNYENKDRMKAYPNPINTTLHVSFKLNRTQRVVIFMIDVNGKKIEQDFVQTMEAGERFLAINTSNYPNGKYFCTIEHDGIAETISFVIQK